MTTSTREGSICGRFGPESTQTMRNLFDTASLGLLLLWLTPVGCSLSMERYPTGSGWTISSGGTIATGGQANTGGQAGPNPTCEPARASNDNAGASKTPDWDWVGIIGTGQSLSVGTTPVTSTSQPYHNLKLSLGDTVVPPWDAEGETVSMVPLVEPIRPAGKGFPRPYPGNIYGETPHSAMANAITFLARCENTSADYVTVHTVVGESGQGIEWLRKQTADTTGERGRAYAATLFEVEHITRLAREAGKSYGVGAVIMTHGETDSGNSGYKQALIQLLDDYNKDLSAITGQTARFPMYVSQQHAYPHGGQSTGQRPLANIVQWQLGVERKADFVCVGPQYQYETSSNFDGIHLSALGYQMLGEKNAQVYYQRAVLGNDWQPLQPTRVDRSGRSVTVHFHVPVPPLEWDTSYDSPVIAEWANGRGFELRTSSKNLNITGVEIKGDTVVVTTDTDLPASDLIVGYALSSQGKQMAQASRSYRWGQLRDSDPFIGGTSRQRNPNYAVSFEMGVP